MPCPASTYFWSCHVFVSVASDPNRFEDHKEKRSTKTTDSDRVLSLNSKTKRDGETKRGALTRKDAVDKKERHGGKKMKRGGRG